MIPESPLEALGAQAPEVRDLAVEVIRARHEVSVEGHVAAKTRYTFGFGGQWRDLLDDTCQAFKDRGFGSRRLSPAGYSLPIVNGCLVFVWRVPASGDIEGNFAASKTREGGFFMREAPTLFGMSFMKGGSAPHDKREQAQLERALKLANGYMPVVLIAVHSTPRGLSSIDWSVAEYVDGDVRLHGTATIWTPELVAVPMSAEGDSFDSGVPVVPVVEAQKQDQTPDA